MPHPSTTRICAEPTDGALHLLVPFGRLPDLLAELAAVDADLGSALPDALRELATTLASTTLSVPMLRESATGAIACEINDLLRYEL